MNALCFAKTGSLDNLLVKELPKPAPVFGEVLVQVKAAAINPSDLKNILRGMHETTLPRVPGRDFAGIVVEGPPKWLGKEVFGSGGNMGFGRDGSHAEYVCLPENAVNLKPTRLSFEQAAAVGVAYMTAWAALIITARLQPDDVLLILGTGGAVGSAAARIGRRVGARIIGVVRKFSDLLSYRDLPVNEWISLEAEELSAGVKRITSGRGVEVVLDVVGGSLFEKSLACLAWRGRQVSIASNPDPVVSFNLMDFYHNESRLFGVDSLKLSFEEASQILTNLTPGFESGEYPAPEFVTFPLLKGPEAYRAVNESKLKRKVVLVP